MDHSRRSERRQHQNQNQNQRLLPQKLAQQFSKRRFFSLALQRLFADKDRGPTMTEGGIANDHEDARDTKTTKQKKGKKESSSNRNKTKSKSALTDHGDQPLKKKKKKKRASKIKGDDQAPTHKNNCIITTLDAPTAVSSQLASEKHQYRSSNAKTKKKKSKLSQNTSGNPDSGSHSTTTSATARNDTPETADEIPGRNQVNNHLRFSQPGAVRVQALDLGDNGTDNLDDTNSDEEEDVETARTDNLIVATLVTEDTPVQKSKSSKRFIYILAGTVLLILIAVLVVVVALVAVGGDGKNDTNGEKAIPTPAPTIRSRQEEQPTPAPNPFVGFVPFTRPPSTAFTPFTREPSTRPPRARAPTVPS